MPGPEQTPEQTPPAVPQLDVQALIRQKLAEQLSHRPAAPAFRAATSAEAEQFLARQRATAGSVPPAAAPPQTPAAPAAPAGEKGDGGRVDTGVHVTVTNGSGRRFGAPLLAGVLLAGAAAYGVEAHNNGWWPWKAADLPAANVAPQVPGQAPSAPAPPSRLPGPSDIPSSVAPSGSPSGSPEASGSPTGSSSASAEATCTTPNTSLAFTPKTIEPSTLVEGTVTDLRVPLTVNYTRPGNTKQVYALTGAFGIQVNGPYSIVVSAPGPNDSKYPALTYDQTKSVQTGTVVVGIQGGNLDATLNLSKTLAVPLGPALTGTDPTKQGAELSQFFAKHSKPSVTLPPQEALTLYQRIVGDPNALTAAGKQGLRDELTKDAGAVVVQALQTAPNATKVADTYKAELVPMVQQQEVAACIPEANMADVGQYSDFSKLPDMSAQYPMAKDSLISVDTKSIVLNPGQAASGGKAAVPATITVQQASGN